MLQLVQLSTNYLQLPILTKPSTGGIEYSNAATLYSTITMVLYITEQFTTDDSGSSDRFILKLFMSFSQYNPMRYTLGQSFITISYVPMGGGD